MFTFSIALGFSTPIDTSQLRPTTLRSTETTDVRSAARAEVIDLGSAVSLNWEVVTMDSAKAWEKAFGVFLFSRK